MLHAALLFDHQVPSMWCFACRCVPRVLSKESLLILLQGGLLVSRTFLTDRISRIEARAGRHLIAQVKLFTCMLSLPVTNATVPVLYLLHMICADENILLLAELPWVCQGLGCVPWGVCTCSCGQLRPEVCTSHDSCLGLESIAHLIFKVHHGLV